MALGWFGGAKEQSLPELIAQKKYAQAVELLRAQARQAGRDPRLRMQLADTLDAAGRRAEAIPIYLELADGFAREGYVAKAIAVLKKVERIDSGRADVKERLAHLAAERHRPSLPAPSAPLAPSSEQTLEIGIDEIGLAPDAFETTMPPRRPPVVPVPAPPVEPVPAPSTEAAADRPIVVSADEFNLDLEPEAPAAAAPLPETLADGDLAGLEEEFFDVLTEAVKASESAPEGSLPAPPRAVRSPLFEDFTDEEFVAVAAQLELHSYEGGDIVISEGEPGDSLFVLTTGVVKAFVRNPAGRQVRVREMGEGSFFGEISILTRKPRTATITCATPCDLLELDRDALDAIAATHPRVQEVLQAFYLERHGSGEEQLIRGMSFGKKA